MKEWCFKDKYQKRCRTILCRCNYGDKYYTAQGNDSHIRVLFKMV